MFVTRPSCTVSRKTARNVMDSAILRKAKHWGYVCESVDFRALEFAENAVRREPRFFTVKQVQQIIDACGPTGWSSGRPCRVATCRALPLRTSFSLSRRVSPAKEVCCSAAFF